MARIAFIGLGAMGRPMARNLLKHGFPVHGFDLDPRALAELRDAGGTAAASADEACADADVVVPMVVDAKQAEAVLFREGALAATPPGAAVCLMATCPKAVEAIAARVTAAGRRFADLRRHGGGDGRDADHHGGGTAGGARSGASLRRSATGSSMSANGPARGRW